MAQSVRVEFVKLGKGGGGNPENIILALVAPSLTLAVGAAATVAASRPQPPTTNRDFDAVRLTAITNPVFVAGGDDPTATLLNSLRLAVEVPEIIVTINAKFSFIAENA